MPVRACARIQLQTSGQDLTAQKFTSRPRRHLGARAEVVQWTEGDEFLSVHKRVWKRARSTGLDRVGHRQRAPTVERVPLE